MRNSGAREHKETVSADVRCFRCVSVLCWPAEADASRRHTAQRDQASGLIYCIRIGGEAIRGPHLCQSIVTLCVRVRLSCR